MRQKDYLELLRNEAKVFLATTESFPNPLRSSDVLFLDRDFDRDINMRISIMEFNCIFLPEMLRNLECPDVRSFVFYGRLRDEYYDIYDDYFEALKLPEDFRFGIVCRCSEPCRVINEDGTQTLMPGYICCSLSYELLKEYHNHLSLLLDDAIRLIYGIDSRMSYLGRQADEYISDGVIDVLGLWRMRPRSADYFPNNTDELLRRQNLTPEEREAERIAADEEYIRETEEINKAYEKSLREHRKKKPLIRLEYGRNNSTANKVSDEDIVYTPKNYLVLHATRCNHTTIRLSPSQMALYCYIQTYKDYGVSKENLVRGINSHLGKYRKLCTLFCATHTDYDIPKVKVVVSQINRRIKTTLAEGNHSDAGQGSFDFKPWTERLLIKSNERYLYYIGISDVRFRPVIVDENRRFVESPDEYIDRL